MLNKGYAFQLGDFREHERLDLRVTGRLIRLHRHRADTVNNCQKTEHFNMAGHSFDEHEFYALK